MSAGVDQKAKDERTKAMLLAARGHVERNEAVSADTLYRMIFQDCAPPRSALERMGLGEACWWNANRALAEGRHGEAADWFQRAVFADPLFVDYRVQYIIKAMLPMGMMRSAKAEATRATKIEPGNKDAWRALAIACASLGEAEESAAAYDRQIELDPDNPLTRMDRAALAINVGDYETARAMAEPVLATPHRGEGIHTMAMIAYREGRHEEAVELFKEAIEAGAHDEAQVRWNMSLALCAIGRYREGFEQSEWRGKQRGDEPMRLVMNRFDRPRMTRGDLAKPMRVHVHQEMGNGDAIATARYLDALVELGHDVRLETMDGMVELLRRSFPRVKVMPKSPDYPSAICLPEDAPPGVVPRGLGIPPFDVHVPTLSLPHLFGTEVDTVPWRGPYIAPNPLLAQKHGVALAERGRQRGKPAVGFCWSSGIRKEGLWIERYGRKKSMAFDDVGPLVADLRGAAEAISLQVGPERAEHRDRCLDLLPKRPTWDDTAALISHLDLVITVDTAVAHLAGAMGKPVWILMQADGASWHFMCERPGAPWNERSPWYPTARVFRQGKPGDWSRPVEEARRALAERMGR